MGDKSKIEWTDATWNCVVGCSRVSEGCRRCYAMIMAARIANAAQARLRAGEDLTDVQSAYRLVVRWERGGADAADLNDKALPEWNGRVMPVPSRLFDPLRWKRPRMIFVNSMSDMFHKALPFDFIVSVFAVMLRANQHTYQILTKRPDRAAEVLRQMGRTDNLDEEISRQCADELVRKHGECREWPHSDVAGNGLWPLPNVWIGTSVEDQATADERIPHLLNVPAAVRFVSVEPLLGPVNLGRFLWEWGPGGPRYGQTHNSNYQSTRDLLHWIIVGGESGDGARPMHPAWAGSLRDQCQIAGVPFFFKQWGEWAPQINSTARQHCHLHADGRTDPCRQPGVTTYMSLVGKKAAGRLLDGRKWNEMPRREQETAESAES